MPVTVLFETALVLVANPAVPVKSLPELIDYAKKNPGKLSYGTNGLGSAPHFASEQIRMLTGADMVHVPYKAMQQAMLDVATDQIPLAFAMRRWRPGSIRVEVVQETFRVTVPPDDVT